LVPAAKCTIGATFKPTIAGAATGAITITDNAAGSPRSVTHSGTGTDFSISAASAAQKVKAGKSATYTLSLTPISGFAGTVSLGCSGAPPAESCTVSPSSLALSGTGASTAKATVTTSPGKKGTPSGTYTLTFTGSFSTLSHPATATMTVQ